MKKSIIAFLYLLSAFNSFAVVDLDTEPRSIEPRPNAEIRKQYLDIENRSPSRRQTLNLSQRQALFDATINHPIAKISDENTSKYDPDEIIGYCFGRAMTVHMLARKTFGLASQSIRKLFIIGDLTSEDDDGTKTKWRFHVTTLVRSEGNWYAIDPITDGPMPAEEWIRKMRTELDPDNNAKFYLVENSVILPDLRVYVDLSEIEKEDGTHILEMKFDPTNKFGIRETSLDGEKVFRLSAAACARYFAAVMKKQLENPFDFVSITVNGGMISYHNYFDDLLDSITNNKPRDPIPHHPMILGVMPELQVTHKRQTLFGLNQNRLNEFLKGISR